MKKLTILLTALVFTGCAANPAFYKSTPQNYRPKGEDKTAQIEGRLIHKKNLISDDYAVVFSVNSIYTIGFQLDNNGNGNLSCITDIEGANGLFACHPHNGKPIAANCIGSTSNGKLISTTCSLSYDNEIAANFKF